MTDNASLKSRSANHLAAWAFFWMCAFVAVIALVTGRWWTAAWVGIVAAGLWRVLTSPAYAARLAAEGNGRTSTSGGSHGA